MWLLAKKKGVSIMVGYVLLVTCAIIIAVFVYQWIKTYVPADALECPEGVSIFIKDVNFICENLQLNLTLKNNGMFNIAGYFIHATNDSNQTLATIDVSNYTQLGKKMGGTVLFKTSSENSFKPNDETTNVFDLSDSDIGQIYSIEIIPVRFQEEENKMRFVSCGNSRVKEDIICWVACIDTCESLEYECGIHTICEESVPCGNCFDLYGEGYVCNSTGKCVPPEECFDNCSNLGYECGVHTICGVEETCPPGCDLATEKCVNGICILSCGDGVIDTGEECDDGDTDNGDGCSSTCTEEVDWDCSGEPSVCIYCDFDLTCDAEESCLCSDCELKEDGCPEGEICYNGICDIVESIFNSCGDYCFLFGYSNGVCQDNSQKCIPPQGPVGGTYIGDVPGANETIGNNFCIWGDPYCCCIP